MGLLDIFDTAEGQQALGLLAAGSARSDGAGFGQRLSEAVAHTQKWKQQQAAQEEAKQMAEFRKQQMAMQAMQMQEMQAKAAQEKQLRELIPQFSKPAQPGLAPIQGDAMLPPDLQAGILPSQGRAAVPASFDREGFGRAYEAIDPMKGFAYQQGIQKDNTPITVAPGASLVDKHTFKPVFTAPKEFNKPAVQQEYEAAVAQGYKGTLMEYQIALKRAGASNTNVNVNEGQKGFDNTLKLRTDFRSEPIYKAHSEVQSAYQQIQKSLQMASPVGDLAGATKIMKLLDPGSVVRESELGMAMAASGALDRLQNYAGNVINGTKLTPTQRKDFQTLADALYQESSNQYNGKRAEYQGIAERNKLNAQDILGNPSGGVKFRRFNLDGTEIKD